MKTTTRLFVAAAAVASTVSVVGVSQTASGAGTTSGTISGLVFNDYNSDGAFSTGGLVTDVGLAGVEVRAFDADGDPVGTASTGAGGAYTLNVAAANSGDIRVEFATPDGFESSFAGPDNGSSVQFVSLDATDVSYGVLKPADFCQNNPDLAIVCSKSAGTLPTVQIFPYESGTTSLTSNDGVADSPLGEGGDFPTQATTTAASVDEVGSTRGLAYHADTQSLFAAAYSKRHASFPSQTTGSDDPGNIYLVPTDGSAPTLFISIPAGTDQHDYTGLVDEDDLGNLNDDVQMWAHVSKSGWGDIDLDDAQENLYAVNLFDKLVYQIPVDASSGAPEPGNVSTIDLTSVAAGCSDGDWAPGAVTSHDGLIYVSVTCTAETSQDREDLQGFIYEVDPAGNAVEVANFPLDYNRDSVFQNQSATVQMPAEFQPWVSLQPAPNSQGGINPPGSIERPQGYYPMPWVSDIEFDDDDNMVIGVSDRFGDVTGSATNSTGTTANFAGGDVIQLTSSGGTWSLNPTTDFYNDAFPVTGALAHSEAASGSVFVLPGSNQVVSSAYDPAPVRGPVNNAAGDTQLFPNPFQSGGPIYLNQDTGARERGFQIYAGEEPGTFGKGSGIGDIEALCDRAPVQVGNRVWEDLDGDGIQDPGELPIAGVTVSLYDESGTLVGSAITAADGSYYFASDLTPADGTDPGTEAPAGDGDSTGGGLVPGVAGYEIRFDNPADYAPAGPLADFVLTDNDQTSDETSDFDDSIDSDAVEGGTGFATIPFDVPEPGENDHTLDAGFYPGLELGDEVFFDTDNSGDIGPGDLPVPDGVVVNLLDEDGDIVATTTTLDGKYLFTGLAEGDYVVEIPASEFAPGAALAGYGPSTGPAASTDPNDSVEDNSDAMASGDGGVQSGPVSLSLGGEPTDDLDPNTTTDANSNLTVDLGLIPGLELGDEVFFDTNNSGDIDAGDTPVPDGVVVNLLDEDGDVVATTTTLDGKYLFTGLTEGDYVVEIPAAEFAPGGPLAGYGPSTGPAASTDPNDSVEDNSDAIASGDGGVQSGPVTLSVGGEPTDDLDPNTVGDADSNLTVDLGLIPGLELGNQIWIDTDNNGVLDAGEAPVAGATVELLDAAGNVVGSTTTDADGQYLFSGLAPGDYVVSIPASNFDDGAPLDGFHPSDGAGVSDDPNDGVDSNSDGIAQSDGSVQSGVVTLGYGTEPTGEDDPAVTTDDSFSNLTVDFGFYTLSLGDTIWFDADNSGTLDDGEDVAGGVTVELLDEFGNVVATTTTDADGNYLFAGLAEGEYTVRLPESNFADGGPLEGFISSTGNGADAPDPDDDVDDDDNGNQFGLLIISDPISLSAGDEPAEDGTSNTTVDFGVIPAGSIGSTVFEDSNSNGQLDANEAGIPGVTVNLLDGDGNVLATTTTGPNGTYLFDNLPPGDYIVEFIAPTGRDFTTANTGNDGSDSDANPLNGRSGVITLGLGEDNPTVFAGIVAVDLPATGGNGVAGLLLLAFTFLLAGLALLTARRFRLQAH